MIYTLGDRQPILEGTDHFVAENAAVIGKVVLKSHSSVWFSAVLRGDMDWIEIGERSNVQDCTVLHTDLGYRLVVGDGVTVGHRAMLHGCKIGNNTLIGIGTIILNGATIGENCVIGAHTLVTKDQSFPDGSLILGTPARRVRGVNDAEIEINRKAAARYVENAALFRENLRPTQN